MGSNCRETGLVCDARKEEDDDEVDDEEEEDEEEACQFKAGDQFLGTIATRIATLPFFLCDKNQSR